MTAVLRAEGVSRSVGPLPIVVDVSLEVAASEWVSLVGPSGCGKTTLLMLLGLLDTPDRGSVWLDGEAVAGWSAAARARARLSRIGFVFQTQNLFDHLSARDNVALPAWRACGSRPEALRAADALLERFGLTHRAATRADRLSTGEAQRTAIARALVNRPKLVFADEPTGSLDSANTALVLDALAEVTAGGAALLVATHDAGVAARGRPLMMKDGRLAEPTRGAP
ncbi:MAG: ATP-binding cassette domain-containing protein [Myxococcales bacterium]|nr:ATP-binding cassette domain-containing protein [Myxococcales bacterium]